MNRRRSHLEALACALLVAVLAVQPATGGGRGAPEGNGPGAAASAAGKPDAGASAAGKPGAGAPAAGKPGTRGNGEGKSRGGHGPNPPGPPVDPGPPPGVTPGPPPHAQGNGRPDHVPGAAPPEERSPGTPPGQSRPSGPAPAPRAPSAQEETPRRGPANGPSAARHGGHVAARAPALAATPETPQTGAVAVAPPAVPNTGSGAPAAASGARAGSSRPPDRAAERRAAGRRAGSGGAVRSAPTLRAPLASAGPAPTPSAAAPAIPSSALEAPLVTPATEAITRVRPAGPATSGGPRPSAGHSVQALQDVDEAGPSDSVGEVLASWAKYALAGLGLLVLALAVNAMFAAARTRRLERQRERLMEDIGLLQAALLPAVPARLGALLTTVAYRPADGPAAGGDFYDAFALADGRVGFVLGDVSGHGRQALAKTTLVRFTVRAHLDAGLSPREALAIAGRTLDGRLSDDFATVIAAVHDPVKGTLTYASAGHPPPIIVGPGRHRPVTASSAPPIGAGFPTGQRQTVLPMPEGTSVMVYSDGLLEARIDGEPIGPERLAAWLDELGPDATAKAILDRVVTHADRVPDDLAAILLHAAPGAAAPAARIEQLKLDVLDMDGPDLEGFLRAAGVPEYDRLSVGRRVSELLAKTSGVVVEVRTGEHPTVTVVPIGEDAGLGSRPGARTR